MVDDGAIRAGRAFVELYADDQAIEPGLARAQTRFEALGKDVRRATLTIVADVRRAVAIMADAVAASTRGAGAGVGAAMDNANRSTSLFFDAFQANNESTFQKLLGGFGSVSLGQTAIQALAVMGDEVKNAITGLNGAFKELSDSLSGLRQNATTTVDGVGTSAEEARRKLRGLSDAASMTRTPGPEADAARAAMARLEGAKRRAPRREFVIRPPARREQWEAWGFPKELQTLRSMRRQMGAFWREHRAAIIGGAQAAASHARSGLQATGSVVAGWYSRWAAYRRAAVAQAELIKQRTTVARAGVSALSDAIRKTQRYAMLGQVYGALTGNKTLFKESQAASMGAIGATLADRWKTRGAFAAARYAAGEMAIQTALQAANLSAHLLNKTFGLIYKTASTIAKPITSVLGLMTRWRRAAGDVSAATRKNQLTARDIMGNSGQVGAAMSSTLVGLAMTAVTAPLRSLANGIQAATQAEQASQALAALTGNAEKAKTTIDAMRQMPINEAISRLESDGVPVLKALTGELGKTDVEVRRMAINGEVSFDQLGQAIAEVARKKKGFAATVKGDASLFSATWKRISDAWTRGTAEMAIGTIKTFRLNELAESLLASVEQIPSLVKHVMRQMKEVTDSVATWFVNAFRRAKQGGGGQVVDFVASARRAIDRIPYYVRNAVDLAKIAFIDFRLSLIAWAPVVDATWGGMAKTMAALAGGLGAVWSKLGQHVKAILKDVSNFAKATFAAIAAAWEAAEKFENPLTAFDKAWKANRQGGGVAEFFKDFLAGARQAQQAVDQMFGGFGNGDALKEWRAELAKAIAAREAAAEAEEKERKAALANLKGKAPDSKPLHDTEALANFETNTSEGVRLVLDAMFGDRSATALATRQLRESEKQTKEQEKLNREFEAMRRRLQQNALVQAIRT